MYYTKINNREFECEIHIDELQDYDVSMDDLRKDSSQWKDFMAKIIRDAEEFYGLGANGMTARIQVCVSENRIVMKVKLYDQVSEMGISPISEEDLLSRLSKDAVKKGYLPSDAPKDDAKGFLNACHENYLKLLEENKDDFDLDTENVSEITAGFWFDTLDIVITAAARFVNFEKHFKTTKLYKSDSRYYLWIEADKDNLIHIKIFNQRIANYAHKEHSANVTKGHLEEFGKVIVKDHVLEKLSQLK